MERLLALLLSLTPERVLELGLELWQLARREQWVVQLVVELLQLVGVELGLVGIVDKPNGDYCPDGNLDTRYTHPD